MVEILTAEEFLESQHEIVPNIKFDIRQVMIEFARMHVAAALKEASEKADTQEMGKGFTAETVVDKDSILNSYPLTNIK
jgi:hypothetical protein